jgi:hypothetical protein
VLDEVRDAVLFLRLAPGSRADPDSIASVITRTPLFKVVISMSRTGVAVIVRRFGGALSPFIVASL